MPVSPSKAKEAITKEDEEAFEDCVKVIDAKLLSEYQGGEITILLGRRISSRVQSRLDRAYKNVGWKQVSTSAGKIVLNEREWEDCQGR